MSKEDMPDQIDELGQNVTALVDKIDKQAAEIIEVKQTWQQDLNDLTAKIKSISRPEADPDIRKALEELMDQRIADQQVSRMPFGGESREFKCFDPYLFETGENIYGGEIDTRDLLQRGAKGFNEFLGRPAENDEVRNLQRVADDVLLLNGIAKACMGTNYPGFAEQFPKMGKTWGRIVNRLLVSYGVKADGDAMDTSDTGAWIPTAFSNQLRDIIKASLRVAALFERVQMPTPIYKLPVSLTDVVADLVGETTDLAGAPSGDTNTQVLDDTVATLTAKKHRGRMVISGELIEDSIVPALPLLRRVVAEALANAEEQAVLDGDLAGTHQDTDVTAATDARKTWDGLRKYLIQGDGTTGYQTDINTFNAAAILDLNGSMGEYGIDPVDTVYITSFAGYINLIKIVDVASGTPALMGADRFPPGTLMTGELGKIWGRPVIVSRYARQDLNASGVNDGVTVDNTYVMAVNRRGWIIGDRREISFEAVRHAIYDQNEVIAFRRMSFMNVFGTIDSTSAKKMGWYGFNVDN